MISIYSSIPLDGKLITFSNFVFARCIFNIYRYVDAYTQNACYIRIMTERKTYQNEKKENVLFNLHLVELYIMKKKRKKRIQQQTRKWT